MAAEKRPALAPLKATSPAGRVTALSLQSSRMIAVALGVKRANAAVAGEQLILRKAHAPLLARW